MIFSWRWMKKFIFHRLIHNLGRINFPNEPGAACNFQRNAINVSPGSVFVGLPSHINDIVGSNNQGNGFAYSILDSCTGAWFSLMPPLRCQEILPGYGNSGTIPVPVCKIQSIYFPTQLMLAHRKTDCFGHWFLWQTDPLAYYPAFRY